MKKVSLLFCFLLCLSTALVAQNYQVGNMSQTFTDNSRSRDIPTDVYYPTENGNIADGQFPVLVFGHGFTIGAGSYSHLWETLVPLGYIIALPTTEGNFSPNHGTFGLDLAFVGDAIQALGNDSNSSFSGKIAPTSAVMGHSMGGGSAFLAAEANANFTTIVTFAAAETNPSAIAAAANIMMPALTIASTKDCVTPNEDHQIPMYEALAASCNVFYNITDGTHCHFSDGSATSCYLGEGFTCIGQGPFLDRPIQHEVMFSALIPWLDYWLKDDCDSWNGLTDYLTTPNATFDVQADCTEICATNNGLLVQAKAHLEGAFNGVDMNTTLIESGILPTNQPYDRFPWSYSGAEMTTNMPTNIVDWVLLEARSASDINVVVEIKAALLLSDGNIVDANGMSNGVLFNRPVTY
ncbi:MAG: alpha/beta hydrolase family protein [Chitinophagales bacterium]